MEGNGGGRAPGGSGRHDTDAWILVAGKVMSHPARVAILRALVREGSASPSAAADAASVSLGTCAYHMRTLLALGVIRLQQTRPVRGAVEHFYELTSEGHAVIHAIEAVVAHAPKATRGRAVKGKRGSGA
jgi:predicted ArsR family transcriptional regulator